MGRPTALALASRPDHYDNVASKCDGHGHRMFVTSNKDQAPSNLVVVSDESCSR